MQDYWAAQLHAREGSTEQGDIELEREKQDRRFGTQVTGS